MSIWEYVGQTKDALLVVMRSQGCAYCAAALHRFEPVVKEEPWGDRDEWRVRVCQTCGWWKITQINSIEEGSLYRSFKSAAAGSLRNLNIADAHAPVEEIRAFLLARYEARFEVDPYVFEQTVASVFGDLGYRVLVTNRSGDDGIDILLYRSDEDVTGVQVKRYRDSISVSHIRELLGALVVNGLTKGIFVTTSRFQSGTARTADRVAASGYNIELIDGDAFYEALRLTRRDCFRPEDVSSLIQRAAYTHISDSGTHRLGFGSIYNTDLLKNLPGPNGSQDDWS